MRSFLLLLPLVFWFNACSQPNNVLPYPLTITEEGLGAIHPERPYDFNTLQASLPGIDFIRFEPVSSESIEHIILLKRGSINIAQIFIEPNQKKIHEIFILSSQIKNKDHRGIGDTLNQRSSLHCEADLCRYTDEPSVSYKINIQTHRILEISYRKL